LYLIKIKGPTEERVEQEMAEKNTTQCEHQNCGREHRIWVPDGPLLWKEVELHPWCVHCGQIKNISDDRGKKVGFWINMLSSLDDHLSLTQVQKRLIVQDLLNNDGFSDLYAVTQSAQKDLFISLIQKYTSYPRRTIIEWLDR
jgi:hypothetical protein